MTDLTSQTVALLGLLAAALGWSVREILRRRSVARMREVLVSAASAIEACISGDAEIPDGMAAVSPSDRLYNLLDTVLARELPRLNGSAAGLGPAIEGLVERIRMAGGGFRDAYRAAVLVRPSTLSCADMLQQLDAAVADLLRRLDPSGEPRRRTVDVHAANSPAMPRGLARVFHGFGPWKRPAKTKIALPGTPFF